MESINKYVGFNLDGKSYALHISTVERIVRAVEITPLPKIPDIILGIINNKGQIIPVINIRKHFHLREREVALSDQFIIANTPNLTIAFVVDAVNDVIEYIEGDQCFADDTILIHNLFNFLSPEEEKELEEAMKCKNVGYKAGE